MQLGNLTTDAAKDYGITFARGQYNAGLPATIANDAGDEVPNPALIASDADYLLLRIGSMIDSWAHQADQAGAPPPPPPPGVINGVPQEVTRRQARQALILSGKFDLVQPAIDAIADATQRALMQSEWDDSQTFLRQRPSLITMATAIGLTSDDLDNLFKMAATL